MAAPATRSFRAKHETLYASERECSRYDTELCRKQDYAGNIIAELWSVAPHLFVREGVLQPCAAADIGCGTGKLARLLVRRGCRSVAAFDRSSEVVKIANAASDHDEAKVTFAVADQRCLPLADSSVDIAIAGWALSYLKSEHEVWNHADGTYGGPWRDEVDRALSEMQRVLRPGGVAVVLETMGTATETPQRAGSHLYAHFLAREFAQRLIRTDYRFGSKREALTTLSFFFGKGVARRAQGMLVERGEDDGPCMIPECTGMWWRQKHDGPRHWLPRRAAVAVVAAAAIVLAMHVGRRLA